jgi:spermidine synthase
MQLFFLYALFVCSGFSALIYQIVWQRSLFSIFGVNVESVTVIVAAFMLGLGLGSIGGGRLSNFRRTSLLTIFGAIELLIGFYGLASLKIFHWVGTVSAGAPLEQTFAISFALVLFPTFLMGTTLPILVTHVVKRLKNVGSGVANLYSANTIGSALSSLLCSVWLLGVLGQGNVIILAAGINGLIGVCALTLASFGKTE